MKKKLSFSSAAYSAPSRRRPRKNPRVACGTVSKKKNKYVGAVIDWRGKKRKVVGCATDAKGTRQYATRVVGAKKTTRYTPIRKGALRDLAWRAPKRVVIKKRKAGQKTTTSERLLKAWEAKYAKKATRKSPSRKLYGAALAAHQKRLAAGKKPAKKATRKNPSRKLHGAAKTAFLKRMAAGRRRASR
jgi:hypothetical protein